MTAWKVSGRVAGNSVPDLHRMSPACLGMAYTDLPIKPMLSPKGGYSVLNKDLSVYCMLGTVQGPRD